MTQLICLLHTEVFFSEEKVKDKDSILGTELFRQFYCFTHTVRQEKCFDVTLS